MKAYLKEKYIYLIAILFFNAVVLLFFILTQAKISYFLYFLIGTLISFFFFLILNYILIQKNFKKMQKQIKTIKQPEFILYMYDEPTHYESKIIYNIIKEVNDTLFYKYKKKVDEQNDYKDYVDLWIHEIKLPLQNIRNLSLLLQDEEIIVEIDKVDFLINKILDLLKINFDEFTILITNVNIKNLINDVIKDNFSKINYSNIKIVTDVEEKILYLDMYWIKFVINQLIDNSVKYRAKTINIKGYEQNKNYIIEIEDDGLGIEALEVAHVFKKYYTASNTKKHITSSGVGLFMVKEVLNKLNIEIKIDSKIDVYTKVKLEIPLKLKNKNIEEIVDIMKQT